jgi:hypothetical protein
VDIMIHFGRRGRGNLAGLTRKDFAVKQDSDGALYVYKTTIICTNIDSSVMAHMRYLLLCDSVSVFF